MSPPLPPKKYEQNQTGCLELSWREKMNNELFPLYMQDFGSF
jgi:hypothetical protein